MGNRDAGRLEQAICDYLGWLETEGYTAGSRRAYKQMLNHFVRYIKQSKVVWTETLSAETLTRFKKARGLTYAPAVRGLARYLSERGEISQPIPNRKAQAKLPEPYEHYLIYHRRSHQAPLRKIKHIRRVLTAFDHYLQRFNIDLRHLRIEHLDAFLAEFLTPFSQTTKRTYRSYLRGFLRYLYYESHIVQRNLAPLVVGAPLFDRAKPAKFLRPHEVEKLFASLKLSSASDLRTYAIVHLAYFLGLRAAQISTITLDDISFRKGKLSIRDRKSNKPVILPLPEPALKAIVAYLVGGRARSTSRRLFLNLYAPYGPASSGSVGYAIRAWMKRAGLAATPYWLRHTYAQNLLEAGASIYEIKEMLGHDSIESARAYLHIHTSLMRKVLFDESL
jgi:site-specific recombinase XerD